MSKTAVSASYFVSLVLRKRQLFYPCRLRLGLGLAATRGKVCAHGGGQSAGLRHPFSSPLKKVPESDAGSVGSGASRDTAA